MKRVRCPKCDSYVAFDETKYEPGQTLVFNCQQCGKEFKIRIGISKLRPLQKDEHIDEQMAQTPCGSIVIIENVFHYKQVIPLRMGDNVIGRYMKGNTINTPIETADPSIDTRHCVITVSRDKQGRLRHTLSDGPSNTGTFVDNEILAPREKRIIADGTLFTIGATSVLLKVDEQHSAKAGKQS